MQEGLFVALLGLLGISPAAALVLSSLKRIVALICALPWAAYYLFGGFEVTMPQAVAQQEVSPMKLR